MPELPEVETVRRHLAPALEGRSITRVDLARDRMARRNQRPGDVAERLTGRTVGSVDRHGKFLVIRLDRDLTWVMHLGMSGRMRICDPSDPRDPHTNFAAVTDAGREIRLVDPRTFGFVAVFTPDELGGSGLDRLGPDALTELPTARVIGGMLAGRTAPIKALLLDQRILAGLGNIYTDEVLHRARIHPLRPGGDLTIDELRRLRRAIPVVLRAGIDAGGTSLDDLAYLLPDGRAGDYLVRLQAYGREGEPCRRCGTPIERMVVAQRSTHLCPRCQPAPAGDQVRGSVVPTGGA